MPVDLELQCPTCQESVALDKRNIPSEIRCSNCETILEVQFTFPDKYELIPIPGDFTLNTDDLDDTVQIEPTFRVVVAIDFGTSRSGYGFAFPHDKQIQRCIQWPDQPFSYLKTLTNLLCTSEGEVVAWGYTARSEQARLRKNNNLNGHHLLAGFKLHLHTGEPSPRGPLLRLGDDLTFPVMDLVAKYLEQLKTFALEQLQGGMTGVISEKEIRWCLTVPAIWTAADKKRMRDVAKQAGLIGPNEDNRLIIVLEPEAAALFCLEQEQQTGTGVSQLQAGTRFMVVDAGGGTVDITVHEVGSNGAWLEEVIAGGGGLFGAKNVDQSFRQYLVHLLGESVFRQFLEEEPYDSVVLMDDWEQTKCNYNLGNDFTSMRMPMGMYQLLKNKHPETLKKLAQKQNGENTSFQLNRQTMEAIFRKALNGIVEEVQKSFQKLGAGTCDYLFLVGGFASSPLLQDRIRREFGNKVKKIVIPPDPGAAVLTGAVSYGLDPTKIRVRRARMSYGCRALGVFEEDVDPKDKKIKFAGSRVLCRDRFHPFVRAGEAVDINARVKHRFWLPKNDQDKVSVSFFASPRKEVRWTDEPHVYEMARLDVSKPDTTEGERRQVEISMYFGRTEIEVIAKDLTTGTKSVAVMDFSGTYLPEELGDSNV